MKRILITMQAAFLVLAFVAGHAAWADGDLNGADELAADYIFAADELDDLLAPIALYPDPLIAQILPAATFIDQIDEVARYVRQYGRYARIDDQPWDVSVKAVAHYPDLLFMMDQKYDWTISLGQAFVNQPQEVMDAIQRLRAEAEAAGSLVSTPQQQVIIEDGIIRIVPAVPEVIYIPQYDPQVVYVERPYPSYGFITFGIGLSIGAWLNRDCDWQGHRVYYHGWRGGGWVSRARPHIHARNNIYINNNYTVINVNRRVVQHDTTRFRDDIRRDVRYRRERAGQPVPQGRVERPPVGGTPRGALTPSAVPVVRPSERPVARPENRDVNRGRETRPASQTGYGGYGSSRDATTYRERGQTSRENMRQFNRQQQAPVRTERSAPPQRPGVPAGRQPAPAPAMRSVPRQAPPAVQQAPRAAPPASRGGGGVRQQR